ncbi:hypothetical protein A3C09_04585 [Candidatus Uhrbacteria bacterium RIFCSPHIGHO2_02_FULL_47_44]|uniref:N-methyl-D-aspartate receptor NMDAR2C subunit n=1 Tax=Candidatus Uhrbacteria bacterium RIFCSPLOWO2_02_FULL_48_18 TaxID=1802408 RepID=A0A1F7VE64_9BACT|nr:MAG: hypothetical protein A2839_04435 [Candidatus Uhrbacteria bacterium RIFCSPHIGHO2_01_FULL_47_10]OGL71909.1 MAG: hypothetical protein A3C09_04585 [Candidatus Uhrbacteria bacterium RIFCSPHIGHO2_02_FULL_47_44]OGL77735.1 MAG: hypothetical protein A3E97_00070 [Candidatus Uhrbacteria bacterium RIFCSPHIGHO2_12_FULL_47_12]OGL80533.1 MAG: hypothetical protein A3B20_03975 [Candidatus Uhrbacteria bacterium RIFCSPLOWO2_01_FULL_47_17]OGL88284.1 MAG: hypothetical protein A3I41_01005 [Candidatus Uhrbact
MQTPKIEPWLAWRRLCEDLNLDVAAMQIGFQELARRYGESHRKYHTLAHIAACLQEFEAVKAQCDDLLGVELAIWFHDLYYETNRKDNEDRSADRMYVLVEPREWTRNHTLTADVCIRATKHAAAPEEHDAQIMVDIDLSILGQPWNVYEEYTRQIRAEYKRVPRLLYVPGRRKIMQSFLDRPHIFSTEFFHARYETQARANITRELNTLKLF